MNPIADDALVASLLALSLVFAVMKLGPRTLRRKIQAAAGHTLAAAPKMFRLSGLAQRLAATSLQQTKGACGGCESCGSGAPAPATVQSQGGAVEVSVPLAKIGRRSGR